MALNNPYSVYKNNSVTYASKEQLLLMLVDGAVKFAKIGKQAIADRNIVKAHENITKTQDIFYELMATLDIEKAGDWGIKLLSIYEFINYRLREANIKKSEEIIDEIIPIIEDVRDTWHEAAKMVK